MKTTVLYKAARAFCRIMTTVLFDLKVYGAHHVPDKGGVLLVSNHQSYLDPVLLGVRIRRPLSYMAKSELFKNPAFGWLIRLLGAFPIKQGGSVVGAVKESIARLHEGHALNIFPEGSRTETGKLMPLERGVALVIRKAKVPVVPVVIDGAFDAWPCSRKMFRPARIRMIYGKPLDMSSMDRDQILQTIDGAFRSMLAQLRDGTVPLDRHDR